MRGKDVRVRNNLMLACVAVDTLFVDSGGDPQNDKGPGDGRTVARAWEFSHNWSNFLLLPGAVLTTPAASRWTP